MTLEAQKDFKVIIVGAGLGGLMAAILLERAKIDYQLLERAATVKPIGAVLSLNANIMPVFKQLGLLEQLLKIALPVKEVLMYNRHVQPVGVFDLHQYLTRTGYESVAFSRPELYDLLLSQIPKEKIHFNKRVLNVEQKNDKDNGGGDINGKDMDKVILTCGDLSKYVADLIIGADGAYSAVRQTLFRELDKEGLLPAVDRKEMKTVSVSLFGMTGVVDPKEFPEVASTTSKFVSVSGNGSVWGYVSLPGNRFSWVTAHETDADLVKRDKLAASEWGADAADDLIREVSVLPLPGGKTMADLIAHSPRDRISKVMLEEKLFETWSHGRVVLIGDACHKMTPGAGQGAVNAMQDAVVLVNCLHNCLNHVEQVTPAVLEELFQDFKAERYSRVKHQIANSRWIQSFLFAQTRFQEFVRWILLSVLPSDMVSSGFIAEAVYQPQVAFLPLAVGNPDFKVGPQMVLRKYKTIQASHQHRPTASTV